MSLVYIDGFEWIVDGVIGYDGAGRWSAAGAASSFDRITDTASGSGAAARLQGNSDMTRAIVTTDTLVVGFRFRVSSTPGGTTIICQMMMNGTRQLYLALRNDGTFLVADNSSVTKGEGTFVMGVNTWVYLELKIFFSNTVGTVELRINGDSGSPDINETNVDTVWSTLDASTDAFFFEGSNLWTGFDDLYLDDADFHGDVQVETIVADGAGADADFTPSAGSNHENVEELPTDNDATYNESNTLDHRDRFTHGNIPADVDNVLAVQVGIFVKKDVAGTRQMRVLAYDGTTEGEGPSIPISMGDYSWGLGLFIDHPTDANPWTESEVNSAEFGYTIEL